MDVMALIQNGVVTAIIVSVASVLTARISKKDASETIQKAAAGLVDMLHDELKKERVQREQLERKFDKLESYVGVLRALLIANKITPPPMPDID